MPGLVAEELARVSFLGQIPGDFSSKTSHLGPQTWVLHSTTWVCQPSLKTSLHPGLGLQPGPSTSVAWDHPFREQHTFLGLGHGCLTWVTWDHSLDPHSSWPRNLGHTAVWPRATTSGGLPQTHQAEICLGHVLEHLEMMNVNVC